MTYGKRQLVLIVHNVRSSHNVGSLLRTAEGLGIVHVFLTGYTPYPLESHDERLPHMAHKTAQQIHKTALGAETFVRWEHRADILTVTESLKARGFIIAALEQTARATHLPIFQPPGKLALIVGREVKGIEPEILAVADTILEIPMFGRKESFNVSVAAAMALYHLRFRN